MKTLRVGGSVSRRVPCLVCAALLLASNAYPQAGGFGGMGGFGAAGGAAPNVSGESQGPALRPWVSVGGSYFKDLSLLEPAAGSRDSSGEFFGGTFAGGLLGSRDFERSSLSGSFLAAGSFGEDSGVRGVSQAASLQYGRQLTQRAWFSIRQMGGSSYGGFGYGSGFGGINGLVPFNNSWTGSLTGFNDAGGLLTQDPGDNGLVDAEPFDNRTNFYSANATLGYSLSRRVTLSGGGGGGIVRRGGDILLGLNTAGASGQLSFQATERFNFGAYYGYSRFTYPGQFGTSDMQAAGLNMSYLLTPRTSFFLSAGGIRLYSNQFGSVAVPPELAEILGVTSVVEVQQLTRYAPNVSGGIRYRPRIGNFSLLYTKGLIPGNGVLRTANRDMATLAYGRGAGRVSYGANIVYQKASGVTAFGGSTDIVQGAGVFSFRVAAGLHLSTSAGYRTVQLSNVPERKQAFANISLGWSPGAYPIGF